MERQHSLPSDCICPPSDNMIAKVALISALLGVALAAPDRRPQQYSAPQPSYEAPSPSYQPAPAPSYNAPQQRGYEEPEYENTPPKYEFDYKVQDDYSGVNFNQQENRDGYKTEGAYYVLLPDGRTQKVTYFVDGDSGYVAEVSYEGEARPYEAPQQSYKPAPQQSYQPAPQPSYQPAPAPQQSYQPAPAPSRSYQPAPAPSRSYQPAPKPAYG